MALFLVVVGLAGFFGLVVLTMTIVETLAKKQKGKK